jgi:hypothetical protein
MHSDNLFQKTAKANPVYLVTLPTAKYPSLPGVEGARIPPRVTPARSTMEKEPTGTNTNCTKASAQEKMLQRFGTRTKSVALIDARDLS